jgi:hypothetical protein
MWLFVYIIIFKLNCYSILLIHLRCLRCERLPQGAAQTFGAKQEMHINSVAVETQQ